MAIDWADYGSRIVIAGGDFRAEWPSVNPIGGGSPIRASREDWARVEEIARRFSESGVEWLIAPTDDWNPGAGTCGQEPDEIPAGELHRAMTLAVACLRRVADAHTGDGDRPARVIGAIGPVQQLLMLGEIEESELGRIVSEQAEAIAAGGADAIICRSFTELESVVVSIRSAVAASGLPVIASMCFDSGPSYSETTLGASIPRFAECAAESGAFMIGCDGSEYPDGAPAIITMLRDVTKLPVYVELNAGRAELSESGVDYPEQPRAYAERFAALSAAGASVVSGGRGAGALHMREMVRAALRASRRRDGAR
ncbi:MAG: homocysteine S-methyltransferase family protein [Phycisphaerae bacterium]|nr:homocysteine S-methyltransferase family protein [Phycisphaerae bacterium]